MSGMGTTLALTGAYTLAGALVSHLGDHEAAFAEYEEKMRPTVTKAQKLAPGVPGILHPESALGVAMLNALVYFFHITGLFTLLARRFGPSADKVTVEHYEFRQAGEM